MKKFNYKFAMRILLRKLNMLSVLEAQWLLRLYCSEHIAFYLRGQSGKLYQSTSATLSQTWFWIKGPDFASSVAMKFVGGPMGAAPVGAGYQRKYYNGTLVTFLVDRIMLLHLRSDNPLSWLVRFDSTSAQAIWDQLKDSIPASLQKYSLPPEVGITLKQRTLFDVGSPTKKCVHLRGVASDQFATKYVI